MSTFCFINIIESFPWNRLEMSNSWPLHCLCSLFMFIVYLKPQGFWQCLLTSYQHFMTHALLKICNIWFCPWPDCSHVLDWLFRWESCVQYNIMLKVYSVVSVCWYCFIKLQFWWQQFKHTNMYIIISET